MDCVPVWRLHRQSNLFVHLSSAIVSQNVTFLDFFPNETRLSLCKIVTALGDFYQKNSLCEVSSWDVRMRLDQHACHEPPVESDRLE